MLQTFNQFFRVCPIFPPAHPTPLASCSGATILRCHRSPITKALWEIRRAEMKFQVEKRRLAIETLRFLLDAVLPPTYGSA